MRCIVDASCALCGGQTEEVMKLTSTPPANALEEGPSDKPTPTYPLTLHLCPECGHVQLPIEVDPEVLFRGYTYVSPPGMREHWRRHAAQMIPRFELKPNDLVVEIGSNNGDLLAFYKEAGMDVLGFEPAHEIAETAAARGIVTLGYFFGAKTAARYVNGKAKLVLANNVFAHVRDLRDFVEGVKSILAPDGVFIFEVQYRVDMLEGNHFDMIYHEHIHYHAVNPLENFLDSCGMRLFDVEKINTHNGSIRCFVRREGGGHAVTDRVDALRSTEARTARGIGAACRAFAERVENARVEFRGLMSGLKWGPVNAGGVVPKIAILGCPAKLTTLAYHFGIEPVDVAYVVDDEPRKQGKLTPGKRWPIRPFTALVEDPVDIAIIGSSNYADALIAKTKALCRSQGVKTPVFIQPLPTPRVTV